MSELKPCPFCGGEIFRCLDSVGRPMIKHKWMPGCILSEIMLEDDPGTVFSLNRRIQSDDLLPSTRCAQPANEPLTIAELREMVGEWVWVKVKYGDDVPAVSGYAFVATPGCFAFLEQRLKPEDYGKTWLAYRRKPEGEVR